MNATEMLLKTYAKKFAKEGVKQLIFHISPDGEFNIETVYSEDNGKTVVNTETYDYLKKFYDENKIK